MKTKTITIKSCEQCPYYMFDYDDGAPKFYGKDVCWFGKNIDAKDEPVILKRATTIPKTCPMPDAGHVVKT